MLLTEVGLINRILWCESYERITKHGTELFYENKLSQSTIIVDEVEVGVREFAESLRLR